jgi:hypothetical protein
MSLYFGSSILVFFDLMYFQLVFLYAIIFLKLFFDYFNLSSVDNWKINKKLEMLFCAGMDSYIYFFKSVSNNQNLLTEIIRITDKNNVVLLPEIMCF